MVAHGINNGLLVLLLMLALGTEQFLLGLLDPMPVCWDRGYRA
jgi:hypothetical protein